MDNIYKNDVYSRGVAMWHNKGRVGLVDETAVQVYNAMEPVTFEQHPFGLTVRGKTINNNVLGIVRVEGDNVTLVGTTKDRYKLLQPIEYATKFDEVIGKPCETLGFLGANADKMFITWKLKAIDVHGDVVELYGFISLGFDGKVGNRLYVTGVRVICANTHAMAISESTNTKNQGFGADSHGAVVTTKHTMQNHLDVFGWWMKFVDQETERQANMTQSLFCNMEERKLTTDDAYGFFAKVYPYPNEAREYIPAELVMGEQQEHVNKTNDANQSRDLCMALWGGQGIAITHTLWGAYNCVTEHQNHHIMSKRSDGTESILIGARGKIMDTALRVASEYISK